MPVTITVSEVREALYRAAGGPSAAGGGIPSTAQLGRWFHECIGQLVGNDPQATPLAALDEVEPDLDVWKKTLVDWAYSKFVGPRIMQQRAALQNVAPQVLAMWQATQAACHWLAELSWSIRSTKKTRLSERTSAWATLTGMLATEEALTCELHEPGWSDSVRLVGIADGVLRLADTGRWCALEFKLGQTSPEADLGQACLYYLMLSSKEVTRATNDFAGNGGALALVSFRPERHEQLFDAAKLTSTRQRLIELIGKLAGVVLPALSEKKKLVPEKVRSHLPPIGSTLTEAHQQLGRNLVRTFSQYGVSVSLDGDPIVGPTFLRFPISLGKGVKVASVKRHAPELQNKLGLEAEPFISQEAGRMVVDVQRPDRRTVLFSEVRDQLPSPDPLLGASKVPVGVDLNDTLHFADLSQPDNFHILVAGTAGSGKSEWLRMAVAALMLTNSPETMQLLVIDPKRNAFHAVQGSPFLWRPIVFPDEQPASDVLTELVTEMDRRYQQFDGANSLAEFVARTKTQMPRIVCVCDEYADLIQSDKAERKLIETQICRLGAKARAAGIHLILATQHPSAQVINGALNANMPARVGLRMQTKIASRMLLGDGGAEQLLGRGDLLLKAIGPATRLQAPWLPPAECDAIFRRMEKQTGTQLFSATADQRQSLERGKSLPFVGVNAPAKL